MFRAVRFAATYDFVIEPATLAAVQAMAPDVTQVSSERIAAELRRILVHANRVRGMTLLAEAELLKPILPEVAPHAAAIDGHWRAALGRLEQLRSPSFSLALAGLLDGMASAQEARRLGKRLRLSNKEIDRTSWLMEHSPEIRSAAALPWPKLQRLLAHEGGAELVALGEASLPADDPGLVRCRESLSRPEAERNPPPLATGDDLIAHGFKSGRHFAALLEHLRDAQLEGTIATRGEALAEAKRWLEQHHAGKRG
jgi:tRNA nucleotidyltransferase/poly(A) polymerase